MKNKKKHLTFIIAAFSIVFFNTIYSQNATIIINQDEKIPEILALKKSLEKDNKLTVGYTIQLYYGELSQANKILKEYRTNFDSWPASIEYETPNYKVWVGNFSSRLEADRARFEIKSKYPAAFILQPGRS